MNTQTTNSLPKFFFRTFITFVWLINGLFCKVLNLVPRHQQIVARILGDDHAFLLTKAIGCSEILMAVWVVSSIKSRWCTITQIALVATMNIIEFLLAPDLLLFGRFNIIVAAIFTALLILNEKIVKPTPVSTTHQS